MDSTVKCSAEMKEKIDAFMTGPNGATFWADHERADGFGKGQLFAVKMPYLRGDGDVSMIMSYSSHSGGFEADTHLKFNSFVNNKTGDRVLSDDGWNCALDHEDFLCCYGYAGPGKIEEVSEVKKFVAFTVFNRVDALSDEEIARIGGLEKMPGMLDLKRQSFFFHGPEDAPTDATYKAQLKREYLELAYIRGADSLPMVTRGSAGFELQKHELASYLNDAHGFIENQFNSYVQKNARSILMGRLNRAIKQEVWDEMVANPGDLQKKREVYEAVQDKNAVWVTFRMGGDELRVQAPVRCLDFRGNAHDFNMSALPGPARDKVGLWVRERANGESGRGWDLKNALISDIAKIEYGRSVIYEDTGLSPSHEKSSLKDLIAGAEKEKDGQPNKGVKNIDQER